MDQQQYPGVTKRQLRARTLNWGIYCLRGMHGLVEYLHRHSMIKPSTYSTIYLAVDACLCDIEDEHLTNGWDGRSRGQQ